MPQPRTQPRRKIVAILAADVAGYSRLMGRDEEGTYAALRGHLDDLIIPQIEAFEGRIIKFIGDGVLAEFPSAVDALNCAARLQAEMAVRNRDIPADRQLNFRIGLHVGDVMEADGDLFGDGVNTAARVEGTATPGGINVSRFVYDSVRKKVPFEFEDLGEQMFKSFEEPVQVYRVTGFMRPRTELRLGDARERIAPGTRLNGIYVVDQLLAVGSTSEVYRARSVQTGDPVVIKAFAPQLLRTADAIDNVRGQASALCRLSHDAIARTFFFSVDEAVGQAYLAMEAVDGLSLLDRVRHEPLTLDETMVLRQRVASALAEAHAAGVVHGALSPENIVLPEGDVTRAKLIDFAISGIRPEADRTVISTELEMKRLFQSPEDVGHFGGHPGPASDIYSFGLVLAFAVEGSPPGATTSFAELVERRKHPQDIEGAPAPLRPLLRQMLVPDPAERTLTMAEVAGWQGAGQPAPKARKTPPSAAAHASAAPSRRPRKAALLAASVVVLTLLAGGAWFALTGNPPETAAVPAGGASEPASQSAAAPPRPRAPETIAAPSVTEPPQHVVSAPSAPSTPPGEPPASQAADDRTNEASPSEQARRSPFASAGPLTALDGRDEMPGGVAEIVSAVDAVNAGACFYASVVSAYPAALDVDMYAGDVDAIYDAYNEIKESIAFDPSVTGRLVSDPQCLALEFMQLGSATSALSFALVSREIEPGMALEGTIGSAPSPRILLIAVDPLGKIYDLSSALQRAGNGHGFALNVNQPARGSVTSLLLAVSVPQGVRLPPIAQDTKAANYLPALANALAASNAPVALRLEHFVLRS